MMKSLTIAAAALAITTGAATVTPSTAQAGDFKFNLVIGNPYGLYGNYFFKDHCYTDWRKVKVGHKWVWNSYKHKLVKIAVFDWKPVKVCY